MERCNSSSKTLVNFGQKKQRKREYKSVKNRGDVVNVDRISDLPEALILQILCLLPAKKAIATSVLSKQWKSHWKMMPQLNFDSHSLEIENICKHILSHKAPALQSLHLNLRSDKCSAVDIGILIGIALARNVRHLILKVYPENWSFIFPRCLYKCETLETLKLKASAISMYVPSSVCWKSLRTLHLHSVLFKDEEAVRNLLSGCPKLEDLMIRINPFSTVKTFTIAVPSLQILSIINDNFGEKDLVYVINTPCLKYFKIQGVNSLESCLMENVPELVEASITDVSKISNDKLLRYLLLVKRLSLALSPFKIKFPTGSIFYKLVYLELDTTKEAWWNLLTLMLDSCPKLQVLKLLAHKRLRTFPVVGREWNQPKDVPECLLCHLEIFMWEGYVSGQVQVAKYILKNSNRLKRATFSLKCMGSEAKLEVVKDLETVVCASSSCQFQFS